MQAELEPTRAPPACCPHPRAAAPLRCPFCSDWAGAGRLASGAPGSQAAAPQHHQDHLHLRRPAGPVVSAQPASGWLHCGVVASCSLARQPSWWSAPATQPHPIPLSLTPPTPTLPVNAAASRRAASPCGPPARGLAPPTPPRSTPATTSPSRASPFSSLAFACSPSWPSGCSATPGACVRACGGWGVGGILWGCLDGSHPG